MFEGDIDVVIIGRALLLIDELHTDLAELNKQPRQARHMKVPIRAITWDMLK